MTRMICALALAYALLSPSTLASTSQGLQSATTQEPDAALAAMANTERAFAQRATVVGWKQAFLEYFSDSAVGFNGDNAGSAKDQLRQIPDPPKDVQLLWEPRVGDIAASGDLGWLTGPSTTINPARNNGAPRYGNYASVWKRQPDGSYKVVIDVGITIPSAAPFAAGFTRAPHGDRYTGRDTVEAATASLRAADSALTTAARAGQAAAYRGRTADGMRLHRTGVLPIIGETTAIAWLRAQPPYASGETRFAETAASRDLGYTWGSYALTAAAPPAGAAAPEKGFYTRVWVRAGDGAWKVALDVLQPQ